MPTKTTPKKKPSKKKVTPVLTYTDTMNDAIRSLSVAQTFAEDGAQLSAIVLASEAITLLTKAYSARETYLARLQREQWLKNSTSI